jgi:Leucine-rich repeat (LRR) protein
MGKLAPNLKEISLKRLSISNTSFKELVHWLHKVEKLDISECPLIEESGLIHFFEKNGECLKELSASNCQDAITNNTLKALTDIKDEEEEAPVCIITFLDISYCKRVTDEGLAAFEGKTYPLTTLNVTGCNGISGKGLVHPIMACTATLEHFIGGLLDQEEMKQADFGKALGLCTHLKSLDVGGNKHMTDEFFNHLTSQEIEVDGIKVKIGLSELHTVKLNFLENLND